eukprot:TRINITY_DN28054_c0_g1_i1.p1 TRINITY_DN28054_c0_g1~~TRINITY_DN28054_c0_g1_i1.p1  ORF type:complete len:254 (+),score=26.78 TRINITY_DN28054_c0_g1_i1:57-764(+)
MVTSRRCVFQIFGWACINALLADSYRIREETKFNGKVAGMMAKYHCDDDYESGGAIYTQIMQYIYSNNPHTYSHFMANFFAGGSGVYEVTYATFDLIANETDEYFLHFLTNTVAQACVQLQFDSSTWSETRGTKRVEEMKMFPKANRYILENAVWSLAKLSVISCTRFQYKDQKLSVNLTIPFSEMEGTPQDTQRFWLTVADPKKCEKQKLMLSPNEDQGLRFTFENVLPWLNVD